MTVSEAAPGAAIDFHRYPDANGHFGRYGGRFVAETLVGPLQELAAAYDAARVDPAFVAEFEADLKHYVGRPSPVYFAERLSRAATVALATPCWPAPVSAMIRVLPMREASSA